MDESIERLRGCAGAADSRPSPATWSTRRSWTSWGGRSSGWRRAGPSPSRRARRRSVPVW